MTYTLSESQRRIRGNEYVADIDRFVVCPTSPLLASLPFFVPPNRSTRHAAMTAGQTVTEKEAAALADALNRIDCGDIVLKTGCGPHAALHLSQEVSLCQARHTILHLCSVACNQVSQEDNQMAAQILQHCPDAFKGGSLDMQAPVLRCCSMVPVALAAPGRLHASSCNSGMNLQGVRTLCLRTCLARLHQLLTLYLTLRPANLANGTCHQHNEYVVASGHTLCVAVCTRMFLEQFPAVQQRLGASPRACRRSAAAASCASPCRHPVPKWWNSQRCKP